MGLLLQKAARYYFKQNVVSTN